MARTLIHIGMPRAASTFFQQAVLPRVAGFHCAGVERTQYSDAFQQMMYQDDSLFDAAAFAKASYDLREVDSILSNELFVGQSLYLNATNRSRNFARLAAAFPEGEAVLVLRNQEALLRSLYCIGVYSGFTMGPAAFLHFGDGAQGMRVPTGEAGQGMSAYRYATFHPGEHIENYRYSNMLSALNAHFRKVHVFLFEDFQADPQAFLRNFAERLKIELHGLPETHNRVNRSLSARQISLLLKLNPWKPLMDASRLGRALFRRKLQFIERHAGGKQPFRFNPSLEQDIRQYFQADNARLLQSMPELDAKGNFSKYYLQ